MCKKSIAEYYIAQLYLRDQAIVVQQKVPQFEAILHLLRVGSPCLALRKECIIRSRKGFRLHTIWMSHASRSSSLICNTCRIPGHHFRDCPHVNSITQFVASLNDKGKAPANPRPATPARRNSGSARRSSRTNYSVSAIDLIDFSHTSPCSPSVFQSSASTSSSSAPAEIDDNQDDAQAYLVFSWLTPTTRRMLI